MRNINASNYFPIWGTRSTFGAARRSDFSNSSPNPLCASCEMIYVIPAKFGCSISDIVPVKTVINLLVICNSIRLYLPPFPV